MNTAACLSKRSVGVGRRLQWLFKSGKILQGEEAMEAVVVVHEVIFN